MADYSRAVSMFPPEPDVATAHVAQAGSSPDQAAAAIPVAKQLNIPPILVESDPAFWKEQARLQGARQAIGTAPLVAPWLAADPTNAKLAADDVPQLAKVAPAIPESAPATTLSDSIARGWAATEHQRAVADAALGIGETPAPLAPVPPSEPGVLPYLRETFGSFVGSMGSTLAHAAPVAAAGAAIGAPTGPIGALAGAGTGLLYGFAADMALTAGGAVYEQTGAYRDGDGNPLPEPARKFAAVAAGAGTAALSMLLPGVGKPALEAGKALITETVTQAVPQIAAEIGKAGLKGGLLNMAFTAVQSIPEELARLGTPGFDNLVSDPQARAEFVEKHVQAFIDGVVLFGALGIPGALVHPLGAAIAARSDAARLDRAVEAAADSKLKGRSPEAFGDFVRSGNKDDIGIVPNNPEQLAKVASPERIATASVLGGDVHVPLSSYVATVDPATHATLRDDIRANPDGMTLREATEQPSPMRTENEQAIIQHIKSGKPLGYAVRGDGTITVGPGLDERGHVPVTLTKEQLTEFRFANLEAESRDPQERAAGKARVQEILRAAFQARAEGPPVIGAAPTPLPRPGESPIEVARRTLYLEPLIKEPLPGMTQDSFARYSRLLAAQAARADEVPAPLAGAREAAEAKVDRRRDVAAVNAISASEDLKLDPAAAGTKLDPALLREGGMHPDDIAASLGYRSGTELVRDLAKVDREALIKQEVARTAAGSLLNRVLNSKQLDVLIAEVRALGGPALTRDVLRDTVQTNFDGSTLRDAMKDPVPVVVRTGRAAEQALLKGDVAGALVAKQQQAVAFERARQQKALDAEVKRWDRLTDRYARRKVLTGRDQEYTNHIQAILGGLGRPLARQADELLRSLGGESLEDFIREKTAAGRIVADAGGLPRGKPLEQWTVAEFRQLHDVIRSLDHNSREEGLVGRAEAKIALDSVVKAIRDNLAGRIERIDPFDAGSILRRGLRYLDAALLKAERLFDWIDQKDPEGPLNANVMRPIKEAQFSSDAMLREAREAVLAIDDPGVRSRLRERVDNPLIDTDGRPMRLTRGNVIAMALNMGSRSNFDKLVRGFKWDAATVEDLVNRTLTADEWKFVQGVWDLFKRFRERADGVVRRVSGIGMDLVEPREIATPHGTFKGGYYPIEYDPLRSDIGDIKAGDLFQRSNWFNPLPPAGYTKTRTGVAKPLRLDLDFIGNRLGETIHDIAYREALISANKVLSNRAVRDAITRSYGPEYTEEIKPWLRYIANRSQTDDRGLGWVNDLSREARLNVNVLSIGINIPTAVVHSLSALSNSIRESGPANFAGTVADFFRHPTQMRAQWKWANEMSGELRNRVHTMDRDMDDVLRKWSVDKPTGGIASVRQHFALFAMSLISSLDKLSAVPTWIAAYKKGLSEGMSDADAVYYGDKVVRNAHGAGGLPDLSASMRGPEVMRWFTMFMSYFNHNYNQVRDVGRDYAAAYRDVKIGDLRAGTEHFVSATGGTVAYLLVPALVHELIKQGLPQGQQGDNWGAWVLRGLEGQVLSMFPVVRDVANFAIQHRGRGIEVVSPLNNLLDTMWRPLQDLAHKVGIAQGPVSADWVRHALAAPTAFIGIGPPEQVARAGQFLWDISRLGHYRQYAHDPVAWYRGLVYGKSHPAPVRP